VRQEVSDLINLWASKLELYDDRFPDSEQCGGYHAFRRLCLREQALPKGPFRDSHGYAVECLDPDVCHLHVLLREVAVNTAHYVRKQLKKQKL
jgi:hypothetical protein